MTQKKNCLRLKTGHEHDVCMNDKYVLYSFDSSKNVFNNTNQILMKTRVISVRNFTSNLKIIDSVSNQKQIKTKWKTKLFTRLSFHKISIKILIHENHQIQRMTIANQKRFLNLFSENDGKKQFFFIQCHTQQT